MNLLKGKTINFIGDSITWGCDGSIWDGLVEHPFPELVAKYFDCNCNNYGIDCSTLSNFSDPMFTRNVDEADITIVFGGVNDYLNQVYLSKVEQGIQLLINKLKGKTKIIFVTPLMTGRKPERRIDHPLIDYTMTIVKKCIQNHIDVIETGLLPFDLTKDYDNNAFSGDNLHPNQEGYMFLAMYIGQKINQILTSETW